MKLLQGLVVAAAIASVPACVCNSDLCPAGGGIPIGGGGSSAAPSRPLFPPINMAQEPQEPDELQEYEVHGAVNPEACKRMYQRFLNEGRKVRLARIAPNPFNKSGGVLRFICMFDGEDADPEATPFEDTRFPKDDSAFP